VNTLKETSTSRRRRRAVRLVAGASIGLIVSTFAAGFAGGAEEEFIPGSGKADARIFNIGPKAAKLSLAPTIGVALADYSVTLGRGESLIADWVGLEGSIPAQVLDLTPPLRAESSGTAECRDRVKITPAGSPFGAMEQRANAKPEGPYGQSFFKLNSLSVPGAFDVAGAVAHSTAQIIDGKTREAKAVTDISELSLAGGAVRITGLHWEAIQRTGAGGKIEGSFSVEALKIAGLPIPLPESGLGGTLKPINDALAPLGIALSLPTFSKQGGVARITPLGINISESDLRQQLLGPLLGGIQPVRQPLVDELLGLGEEIDKATGGGTTTVNEEGGREVTNVGCPGDRQPPAPGTSSTPSAREYAATSVLLTDISLGALSGVSNLNIVLGGASAFTEGQSFDDPFAGGSLKLPPLPQLETIPGAPGIPDIPGTPAELPQALPGDTSTAGRTVPGGKGGVAIWIGLAGLVLAAAIGGTDWYLIRRGRMRGELPIGPPQA
jgi:hypothetical protein